MRIYGDGWGYVWIYRGLQGCMRIIGLWFSAAPFWGGLYDKGSGFWGGT